MGTMRDILDGSLGGVAGTALMSVLMLGARRAGLISEHPPERIAATALEAAGIHRRNAETQDRFATALHFGFGTTSGALFGLISRRTLRVPTVAVGVIFGTLVWAISYSGWVPALNIMPPPHEDEQPRPQVMLLGHWIYGAALGTTVQLRTPSQQRTRRSMPAQSYPRDP